MNLKVRRDVVPCLRLGHRRIPEEENLGFPMCECSFSSDRMRCDYDPVLTSPSGIRESLSSLGYEALSS